MAENIGALILPIGADASQFNRSINDVKAAFKELSNTIASTPFNLVTDKQKLQLNALKETLTVLTTDVKAFGEAVKIPENSILGLTNRIAELNKKKISLDAKTSASEIARLTKEIEKLTAQKNNIDNLGRAVSQIGASSQTAFKKVQDSSKGARTALTSLSLVAQDAPFGFIAIQNNLPSLIQSFGELQRTSGGTKGALGQLASALKGPAGLFLAFSAVTAAVTFAIQKYGSFGAAVDELFGKVDPLRNTIDRINKSFEDYSKNLQSNSEITKLAEKNQAGLIQTVEILSRKATDLSLSEQERGKYLNQLKEIDSTYFSQLNTGADNVDKIKKATDQYTQSLIANSTVKAYQSQLDAIEAQIAPLTVLREQLKENKRLAEIQDKFNQKVIAQSAKLGGGAAAAGLGDPIGAATKKLDENAASLENLYKQRDRFIAGLTESIDNLKNVVKPITEPITGDAGPGDGVDKEWERMQGLIAKSNERLAEYYAKQLQIQADKNLQNKLKADADAYKLLEQSVLGANEANAEFGIGLQNQIQGIDTTYANAAIATGQIIQRFRDAQMSGANEFARIQEQIKSFDKLKSSIESNLTKPFRDFFDELLTNGKVSFDGFVELAKDAFKRILAQAIASGIANLIASLLSGGITTGLGKLGAAKRISATLSGLGKVGGLFGSANFSGVQGSSMQMAGAVNLTLRGSDLVASINRTNSTINRVG